MVVTSPPNPIRVTFIHHDGLITGSSISLLNMLRGFAESRIEAQIIFLYKGPAIAFFRDLGFTVHLCREFQFWTAPGPSLFSKSAVGNILSLLPSYELRKLIKKTNPHLVHVNDKAAIVGAVTASTLGLPVVIHARSPYSGTHSKILKNISRTAVTKFSDHIIAVSENEYSEFNTPRKSLIYNTVNFEKLEQYTQLKPDLIKEFNINQTDLTIGFIGQLSYRKGAWEFLEAAGEIQQRLPKKKIQFILVGEYQPETKLQPGDLPFFPDAPPPTVGDALTYFIRKHHLENTLTVTGYREDALGLLSAFDITVVFSCFGSLGRQAFEALAAGSPSVIEIGKNKNTYNLIDKDFAVVVQSRDTSSMVEGILEMYRRIKSGQKSMIQEKARAYAREEFSAKVNSRRIEQVYVKLLNECATA